MDRAASTRVMASTADGGPPTLRPHPLDEPGCHTASRLLLFHHSGLMKLGSQRPLQDADLWQLPRAMQTGRIGPEVDASIAHELATFGARASFRRVLWRVFRRRWCATLGWCLAYLTCFLAQPLLIRAILKELEVAQGGAPDPLFAWVRPRWLIAVGLAAVTGVMAVSMNQWWIIHIKVAVSLRVVIMRYVYRKALRLASHARQASTTGRIVTLMSVDGERIFWFAMLSQWCVLAPIIIVAIVFLIAREIGWAGAGAAVAVLALLVCLQWAMGRVLQRARRKMTRWPVEILRDTFFSSNALHCHSYGPDPHSRCVLRGFMTGRTSASASCTRSCRGSASSRPTRGKARWPPRCRPRARPS